MIPRERLAAVLEPVRRQLEAEHEGAWCRTMAERIAMVTGHDQAAIQRRLSVIFGGRVTSRYTDRTQGQWISARVADMILTGLDLNDAWHVELADLEAERASGPSDRSYRRHYRLQPTHATPESWRQRTEGDPPEAA